MKGSATFVLRKKDGSEETLYKDVPNLFTSAAQNTYLTQAEYDRKLDLWLTSLELSESGDPVDPAMSSLVNPVAIATLSYHTSDEPYYNGGSAMVMVGAYEYTNNGATDITIRSVGMRSEQYGVLYTALLLPEEVVVGVGEILYVYYNIEMMAMTSEVKTVNGVTFTVKPASLANMPERSGLALPWDLSQASPDIAYFFDGPCGDITGQPSGTSVQVAIEPDGNGILIREYDKATSVLNGGVKSGLFRFLGYVYQFEVDTPLNPVGNVGIYFDLNLGF